MIFFLTPIGDTQFENKKKNFFWAFFFSGKPKKREMVQVMEFRVVMPLSLEEYKRGHLYMVSKMEEENTGGEEGVEVLKSETFLDDKMGKGRFTHKLYRLASKVPRWAAALAPKAAVGMMEERAWNAYPYMKTELTCPYFPSLKLTVESRHLPDTGNTPNALHLSQESLSLRQVSSLSISSDPRDWWSLMLPNSGIDLQSFTSAKSGRGPLISGWEETSSPVMTAYKVVTVDVPYWGWGFRAEKTILSAERALFLESHRKIFGWIDEWFEVSMEELLEREAEHIEKLNESLGKGQNSSQQEEKLDNEENKKIGNLTPIPVNCHDTNSNNDANLVQKEDQRYLMV